MNKRFLFSILSVSLFFSQASFAGWKEAGGDDSLVFKCSNESSIILGYQSLYEGLMEVVVKANGKVIAEDMGLLAVGKYEGDRLVLSFEADKGIVVSSSIKKVSGAEFTCAFSPEYNF